MARLEILSVEEGFCRSLLEQFKQYASVPDDSRDALLASLLKTAVLAVQESADKALLTCEVRQTSLVPDGTGIVKLYLGGGTVTSVTTAGGEPVGWDPLPGGRVQSFTRGVGIVVDYTTAPLESDRDRLLPTVFRYATALYDGEDAAVLAQIRNEIR